MWQPSCQGGVSIDNPLSGNITIVGNTFEHGNDNLGAVAIGLTQGRDATVQGNAMRVYGGTDPGTKAGVWVQSGFLNAVVGLNVYNGFTPGRHVLSQSTGTKLLDNAGYTLAQAAANLSAPANGSFVYCSDCAPNSVPCTGGSTGAFMKRLAGIWRCD
jgi:hypothetical protein